MLWNWIFTSCFSFYINLTPFCFSYGSQRIIHRNEMFASAAAYICSSQSRCTPKSARQAPRLVRASKRVSESYHQDRYIRVNMHPLILKVSQSVNRLWFKLRSLAIYFMCHCYVIAKQGTTTTTKRSCSESWLLPKLRVSIEQLPKERENERAGSTGAG